VVDVEQLPLALQRVELLVLRHGQQVPVLHRIAHQQRQPADVVQQTGGVGAVLAGVQL